MATKNIRIMRPLSYWGQIFSLAILFSFVIVGPLTAEAGILFESSWDTATGYTQEAINDGSKWNSWGVMVPEGHPYVSAGGPGGHNFLNMVTPGGGGPDNPYFMGWRIIEPPQSDELDKFGDPDNLYVRFYFRVSQEYVDNFAPLHWFQGVNNGTDLDHTGHHYLSFGRVAEEFPDLDTPYTIQVESYAVTDGRFQANIVMETDRWYRYEILIQKVDTDYERWYIRLDGVDITNRFYAISAPPGVYGNWLGDLYDSGWSWQNHYHGNLWLATYDMDTQNDGWDISALEVRDDTWPGPVGPPVDDTTPPTGSIEITGVEDRTDKTGTTAVTLTLSATDTGSGMSKMEFSRDGVTWLGEKDYTTSWDWILDAIADGTEESQDVYVKFRDVAGNWSDPSDPISASIILDRQPPSAPLW